MTLPSTLRHPTVIAAVSLAGILLSALAVPALMDWNRLRPEIEQAASTSLGRPITLSGPISARLLPSPRVTAERVSVGGVSAQSLAISLRLLPLLAGRREVEELTLSGGKAGPVEAIEARITPTGAVTASGLLTLPQLGAGRVDLTGNTDFKSANGRLRLSTARLTAESSVTLSADELSLPDIQVMLGQSRVSASITANLGSPPILVDISVKAGELNLDGDTTPAPTIPTAAAPATAPAPAPQPVTSNMPSSGFALPQGITASLSLTADSVRGHGVSLRQVELNALLDNGVLSLGQASAQLPGGGRAELNGNLGARDGSPAFDGSLRASLPQHHISLASPVTLRGTRLGLPAITATMDDIHAKAEAVIGLDNQPGITGRASALGLDSTFDLRLDGSRAQGPVSLHAANFAQVARLIRGDYHPRFTGPLDMTARVEMEDGQARFDQFQLRLGEAILAGQGRIGWTGETNLDADLTGNALALAPFLPADAKPLGLNAWRLDKASAHVSLAQGTMTLERLSARLLGGELTGAVRANGGGVAANLAIRDADMGRLELGSGGIKATKGSLTGQVKLSGSPKQVASLMGDGHFQVKDGVVEGFDLAAMDSQMRHLDNMGSLLGLVQAGLSGGSSKFSTLSASFRADRGVVTSRDIQLVAEGGGATGTAVVDLPKDSIDARFAFKLATPDSPPLGLRLEGKLGAPNKIIDINALQRYLVEHGLGKALKEKGKGLIESLLGVKPREKK